MTAFIVGNPIRAYDGTTTATLSPSNFSLIDFSGTDGATLTRTTGSYTAETPGSHTVTTSLSPSNFASINSTNLSNYVLPMATSGAGTITIGAAQSFSLPGQTINAYAGQNGISGYGGDGGDGGAATSATLSAPARAAFDCAGNLCVADAANNVVRKITQAGNLSTYAGNGTAGYSRDGSSATSARLNEPWSLAFDSNGNLYIADLRNNRVAQSHARRNYFALCRN